MTTSLLLLAAGCTPAPDSVPDASPRPDSDAGPVATIDAPAEADAGWLATLDQRLEAARYAFAADGTGWTAASAPQQLGLHADPSGIDVTAGTATVRLGLSGWGAAERMASPDDAAWAPGRCAKSGGVDPTGACVQALEADRGGIREWWEASAQGLEQSFEVAAPLGAGDLLLDLAISGATVQVADAGARLQLDGGGTLRYGGLRAFDASGRALPARMEAVDGGVRLRVDVADASWPVTVDPVISGYWLVSGDATSEYFGYSVSGAGDVNGDGYDDVIVGAYNADGRGEVYAFYGSNVGPSTEADWTATSRYSGARMGFSVAGAGDVNGDGYDDVIVGAPYVSNPTTNEGAAFVYLGSASGLAASSAWSAEGNQANAYFGYVVAGAGDVNGDGFDDVLVGAPSYDDGSTDEGAAFLYFGGSGGPSTSADWTGEIDQGSASYGQTLVGAGDVNGDGYADVLVGAYRYDHGSTDEGGAFVYLGSSSGPGSTADWSYEANQSQAYAGIGLAAPGDTNGDGFADIFVGASYFDNGQNNEGYIWGFEGSGTGPSTTSSWYMEGNASNVYLGTALAGAGDINGDGYADLIVGKPTYSSSAGEYYVFNGSSSGLSAIADYDFQSGISAAAIGTAVASAGDTDGDGYDDVIVGGPSWSTNTGIALVQYGSADGMQQDTAWTWEGTSSSATIGTEVADAGDLDGDGYGDVAVYANSSGTSDYVYVYMGTSSGLPDSADVTLSGTGSAYYGADIDGGGDVNGDGYDDLLVTAYSATVSATNEGSVWVYYGSGSGVSSSSYDRLDGGQANGYFGYSAAFAGDVNADGYDDVIVGAYAYDDGSTNEGEAFLFEGGSSGVASTAAWSLDSDQASAQFGFHVDGAGDVDGDGYDDVVIGASYYDDGQTNEGAIFLVNGSSAGLASTWSWHAGGDQTDAQCAFGVGVGDANGDGYDDLARGCATYDAGGTSSGQVDFWYGGASGPGTSADWTYEGAAASDALGRSVAAAGDLNDDGFDDLVTGASGADHGLSDEGEVDVFYGSATGYDAEPNAMFVEHGDSVGLGYVVSGTADVDGDGVGEVIAGASGLHHVFLYEIPDLDGDGSVSWDDCDDDDASRYPGAVELCDGLDNDCDDDIDEDLTTWYTDADGDGYGDDATGVDSCAAPTGAIATGGDCDDADADEHPGATEVCDGDDDDCDGSADEAGATGSTTYYADSDGDTFGDPDVTAQLCAATSAWIADFTDCDDDDSSVNPYAYEYCDDVDDDCDGTVDDSALDMTTWYDDVDRDGYGAPGTGVDACDAPPLTIDNDDDCNDTDADVSPDDRETCNGVDDDCDGNVDDGVTSTWYADADADGYGDAGTSTASCSAPSGYVADATDCDDADGTAYPGAAEACDLADDDCDGSIDEGTLSTFYHDGDGDGYGDLSASYAACTPPSSYVSDATDCDDGDAAVSPGAAEACNLLDDDCDGTVDEGFATTTWYVDADGDGLGSPRTSTDACVAPDGYVDNAGDCDDADAEMGAASAWYLDADRDGYGDPTTATSVSCTGPDGYVQDGTDCDDQHAEAHPGATEVWYSGVDEACDEGSDYDADGDGQDSASYEGDDCDDADPDVYLGAPDDPYDGMITDCASAGDYDGDADGYTSDDYGGDDCDDARSDVHPDADETWYDGLDQDCDGNDDDQDGDGLAVDADCDDEDASVGACDSGSFDTAGDTGGVKVKSECGCAGTGSAPVGAAALVLGMIAARRRR